MCLIVTERMSPQFSSRILRTSPDPKKFLSHGLREQRHVRRSVRMESGGFQIDLLHVLPPLQTLYQRSIGR